MTPLHMEEVQMKQINGISSQSALCAERSIKFEQGTDLQDL